MPLYHIDTFYDQTVPPGENMQNLAGPLLLSVAPIATASDYHYVTFLYAHNISPTTLQEPAIRFS